MSAAEAAVNPLYQPAAERWAKGLEGAALRLRGVPPPVVAGRLTRMVGLTLEAAGCQAALGDRCEIVSTDNNKIEAEVVGFASDRLYLMPTGDVHGLKPNARVLPRPHAGTVRVGPKLLGRVVDGACQPLDGRGPIETDASIRLSGTPINPLMRKPITQTLDVGVRAINGL